MPLTSTTPSPAPAGASSSAGTQPASDPLRDRLLQAALQAHPEWKEDPARLLYVVSGMEQRLKSQGSPMMQAEQATPDATQLTPGSNPTIVGTTLALAKGIGSMIGDGANALRMNLTNTASNQGGVPGYSGSMGDVATTMATQPQAALTPNAGSPALAESVQRGNALIAGMATAAVAGPLLKIPAAGIVNRVLSATAADASGGAVYNTIAPHPGENTLEAAGKGALTWGLFGGGLTAAHLGTDALGQWFANRGAAHTALDVARDAAQTGATTPAHGVAILDAATDVAVAHIQPATLLTPETQGFAAPMEAELDHPMSRATPPYEGAQAAQTVPTIQQAARAFEQPDVMARLAAARAKFAAHTPEQILGGAPASAEVPADKLWRTIADQPEVQELLSKPAEQMTQIAPQGFEVTGTRATPAAPKDQPSLGDMTGANTWANALDKNKRAGFITARLLSAGTGAAIRAIPQGANEPDGVYAVRKELGGLLLLGAAASAAPDLAAWASGAPKKGIRGAVAGIAERTATAWDAARMLQTPGARNSFEGLKALFTDHEQYMSDMESRLQDAFGKEKNNPARVAAAYAVGPEGQVAGNPYMASLTPKQQGAVQWLHSLMDNTGDVLEQRGLTSGKVEHYLAHMLPDEVMQKMRGGNAQGVAGLSVTPGFTKSRKLFSLTEFQDYLTRNGLPRASEDVVDLMTNHMRSYFRVIRNDAILSAATAQGWMVPIESTPAAVGRLLPAGDLAGWRKTGVRYGPNAAQEWAAPNDVANALDVLNQRPGKPGPIGAGYDALQSVAMRTIMFNPVIHGFNELRAALAAGVGPAAYRQWRDAAVNGMPFAEYAASKGVINTGRATEGVKLRDSFDNLMSSLGQGAATTAGQRSLLGRFADWNENTLFGSEGFVSRVANATFYKERLNFMARHPEVLPGSLEFEAAERKFAGLANDVSGRVNQLMRSDGTKTFMRRLFFAPQWLETRWNLTLGAIKELRDPAIMKNMLSHPVAAAQSMLPGGFGGAGTDAVYLQYKMRALALAGAATYVLSKLMSGTAAKGFTDGKDPIFDPKTARFAAHTGMVDNKGQEIVFDPSGTWQEDLRAFNQPGAYLQSKMSFLVRALPQFAMSQDRYGRPLSSGENLEQIMASMGGLGQTVETMMRMRAQNRPPNAKEILGLAPSFLGAGSVSSMPNPGSMLLSKVARNILANAQLPTDDNRVWELSSLMQHSLERGQDPLNNRVVFWLGNQRRELAASSGGTALFLHAKAALTDLIARSASAP